MFSKSIVLTINHSLGFQYSSKESYLKMHLETDKRSKYLPDVP